MIPWSQQPVSDGELVLREISRDDCELLFRWRADERVRTMFRSPERISWQDHQRFVAGYFEQENRDCWFIIEAAGRPVGTVALHRFDPARQEYEIGRHIIERGFHNRGFSARVLQLLLGLLATTPVRGLRAEVLQGNRAVLGHLRRGGFQERRTFSVGGRDLVELVLPLQSRQSPSAHGEVQTPP